MNLIKWLLTFNLLFILLISFQVVGAPYEEPLYDGPTKIGANSDQQDLVKYAWEISRNFDFILTVERESGFRWDAVGDGGTSYGLCQWHVPGKINWWKHSTDPALENGYTMLDKCWESRQIKGNKVGSWLYGYGKRHQVKNRFSFDI